MAIKSDKLRHPLARFGAVPLAREALDDVLADYRRPNDKVSEWMREGALQALRRGLYVTAPGLRSEPVCLPLVANHLYGPSYVSHDFALAFHGLIPEGVAEVTSVTPKPSRSFSNGLGRFSYQHLPLRFHAMGQCLNHTADGFGFLMATPTKALCDRLVLSRELPPLSRTAMGQWLLEELRIDPDLLAHLSLGELDRYRAIGYKRRQLDTLRAVIQLWQQEQPLQQQA